MTTVTHGTGATCTACGQVLPTLAERIERRTALLRDWCTSNGITVSADSRVSEAVAATILERDAETLRHWRDQDAPLEFFRMRGRISYALEELARYIEESVMETGRKRTKPYFGS